MSGNDESASQMPLDHLSSSILSELERLRCCGRCGPRPIYRVPSDLRELDVKAYEPKSVCIGPYHHRNEALQEMELRKWICLARILFVNPTRKVEDYVREIRSVEPEVRSCYSDHHQINQMGSDEFVKMLLLDSLFLLNVLSALPETTPSRNENRESTPSRNRSDGNRETTPAAVEDLGPSWLDTYLIHDIFLLENQIPFIVLEKIYELAVSNHGRTLKDITKDRVAIWLKHYTVKAPDVEGVPVDHLLHFCYLFFCPESNIPPHTSQENNSNHQSIPVNNQSSQKDDSAQQPIKVSNAVELWKSGITFKKTKDKGLLDINFSKGVLDLPHIFIEDNTISLFRNLIAYEQSFSKQEFTFYALFLSNMINTSSDVELLSRMGIIENHLSNAEELCEKLCKLTMKIGMLPHPTKLKPIFEKVNDFARLKLHRWEAWIRHRYNNPWLVLSLMAAITLLVCTILQTIYTVKGAYCKR